MRRAFFLAAMALATLTGCGDDGADTSAAGGGGSGGQGGEAGQGGQGAQGGEGGQGAEGGQGGDGGQGGSNGWEADCLIGCQKLDTCGFANACGTLGVQCEQSNPMDLAACIVECSATPSTTCDDISKYTTPADAPASPNAFAQCVSACPWGGGEASPAAGCTTCLSNFCGTELNDCLADTACSEWAGCAGGCTDPGCFDACTQAHPNNFSDAILSCTCTMTPGAMPPVPAGAGTADCTDVCGGLMGACSQ